MTHDTRLCFPVPPTCSFTQDQSGVWCPEKADVLIFAPDEQPVPGGWMCMKHGQALVAEFHEKLQETWVAMPIHRYTYRACRGRTNRASR